VHDILVVGIAERGLHKREEWVKEQVTVLMGGSGRWVHLAEGVERDVWVLDHAKVSSV
jgi:hypothetical protein